MEAARGFPVRLKKIINGQRERRSFRVRKKVRGNAAQPRLSVQRTLKHIGCQLIDDEIGKTLVSATTRDKELRERIPKAGNSKAAELLGKILAERAIQAGIKKVCLDRGASKYHGRVAALADAARAAGLEF